MAQLECHFAGGVEGTLLLPGVSVGVGVPAVADTDLAAWSTCLLSHSESLAGLPGYSARRAGLAPSRGSEQSPRPHLSQGLQAPVLLPLRSKLAVAGGGGLGLLSLWSSLFCLLVPVRTLVMTRGRLHAPPSLLARRPSSSQALGVTSLVAVPPSPTGDEGVVPQSPASLFPETCFLKKGLGPGAPRPRLGNWRSLGCTCSASGSVRLPSFQRQRSRLS